MTVSWRLALALLVALIAALGGARAQAAAAAYLGVPAPAKPAAT